MIDAPPPETKPSPADARVLGCIADRRRANPVPLATICRWTGLKRRHVLECINRLVIAHRVPIGSSRGKTAGYWLAQTAEDREAAARTFRKQFINEAIRVGVLLNRADLCELAGQLRISVGEIGAS